MINISIKKRNIPAALRIYLAMTEARGFLADTCEVTIDPGYDIKCENCPAKQGCRDISRATGYVGEEYLKKAGIV